MNIEHPLLYMYFHIVVQSFLNIVVACAIYPWIVPGEQKMQIYREWKA